MKRNALFIFLTLFLIYFANLAAYNHGDTIANDLTLGSLIANHRFDIGPWIPDSSANPNQGPHSNEPLPYYAYQNGQYQVMSIFGIGTPLTAFVLTLPVQFFLKAIRIPGTASMLGKFAAAFMMAACGALFFHYARKHLRYLETLLLTAAFCLGTSMFSLASQGLWQQTGAFFWTTLACWAMTGRIEKDSKTQSFPVPIQRSRKTIDFASLAGFFSGLAVFCRTTHLVGFGLVFLYLRKSRPEFGRKMFLGFISTFVFLLFVQVYFTSTFSLGHQLDASKIIALQKTGMDQLWHFPVIGGLGLLFSPGRGLFVYSPFLIVFAVFFAFGKNRLKTEGNHLAKIFLGSFALMFLVAAMWFDWWGGWSYGPRPIMDALPYLFFGLVPYFKIMTERETWNKGPSFIFKTLCILSICIHLVGALTGDLITWNKGTSIDNRNVDQAQDRLWSVSQNPVFYHLQNGRLRSSFWDK